MANIIILLLLAIGFYAGGRRGLILQIIHTAGYFVSFVVAMLLHKTVANSLEMLIPYPSDTLPSQLTLYNLLPDFSVDKVFYEISAFLLVLLVGWFITRLVASTLNRVSRIPIVSQLNWLGGAGVGLVTNWIGLFFILSFLSFIPIPFIQDMFSGFSLATIIVKYTPFVSALVMDIVKQAIN